MRTSPRRRRPPTDRWRVINVILYVVKGDIPWRLLDCSALVSGLGETVNHVFRE